jgi:hypothetical protein
LAHTVVLLRPPRVSSSTTELLERLRGELLSVGFEVVVRDRQLSSEPKGAVPAPWQQVVAGAQAEAAVDLVGEATPVAVDLWVVDGAHELQRVARVAVDATTENAYKGVAIRASEVLRAHLFETDVGTSGQPVIAPARLRQEWRAGSGPEPNQQSRPLGFELGAAVLTSIDGVGPALLPLVRFDWAIESEFVLLATLAGLGTQPGVETSAGNAQIAVQYGLLGASYRADLGHRLRPLGELSLGALRTSVVGEANVPREGHSVEQWSLLLDASLGAAFQLSPRYSVAFAGHAQLAQPYVAIRFADQKVASVGRPNLLLTLTLGVWP